MCRNQLPLFAPEETDTAVLLVGEEREDAITTIRERHYTRSVSSGKTYYFRVREALVAFSIPANNNISKFLFGQKCVIWELSRLWAPDGHAKNLLTQAISRSVDAFRKLEPLCEAIVSYADPNAGHHGGVYRAASWIPTGQSEEGRYWLNQTGERIPRRAFHSGHNFLRKPDIEALGFVEVKLPGKIRFVHPLTRRARRHLERRFKAS